jgi:hypothetical protein
VGDEPFNVVSILYIMQGKISSLIIFLKVTGWIISETTQARQIRDFQTQKVEGKDIWIVLMGCLSGMAGFPWRKRLFQRSAR